MMTIDELLTELDTFPRPGIQSYEGALENATRLIRAAALTIRQLRAAISGTEDHRDMTMNKYFVLDDGDITPCKTAEEAQRLFNLILASYRQDAQDNGEWDDVVAGLCWGEIKQDIQESDDGEFVNYIPRDVQ